VLSDLTDADIIASILDKLMQRLQEPFSVDGHDLSTSISVGITLYPTMAMISILC